jgi:hypothetical protein
VQSTHISKPQADFENVGSGPEQLVQQCRDVGVNAELPNIEMEASEIEAGGSSMRLCANDPGKCANEAHHALTFLVPLSGANTIETWTW